MGEQSVIGRAFRKIEYAKSETWVSVEHLFQVIQCQFGYTQLKVRSRGLVKTTVLVTLFALSNLWMARRHLMEFVKKVLSAALKSMINKRRKQAYPSIKS